MKGVFVLFLCLHASYAATHSWKAFYTGSTGLNEFPKFVALNLLDDELMGYFDSRTNVFESKQTWMVENLGRQYVEEQTNVLRGWSETFKANVAVLMQRFNQSKGIHMWQQMYGCEWDDETGKVTVFRQFGYDGEDYVAFDLKTETWIAPNQRAFITKNKWDQDKAWIAQTKNYLTQICPEWGKKYVNYGSSSLMRTDLPKVSLLQKTSSSPVTCHATGFYPDRASLVWRKDGEELHENVDRGEILPNHDGTFQMSADLKLSSDASEDWSKYECVFQLSGVEDDIVTRLDKKAILTNEQNLMNMTVIIIVAVAVLALAIAGIGFFVYRQKKAKRPPSPVSDPQVMEQLNPEA